MPTVPCSSTPARTRLSTYSREWLSSTTLSIPCKCKRWASIRPAGPAPTIPTCVRIIAMENLRRVLLRKLLDHFLGNRVALHLGRLNRVTHRPHTLFNSLNGQHIAAKQLVLQCKAAGPPLRHEGFNSHN